MARLNTALWLLFWSACALIAFMLTVRLLVLRPLFIDSNGRERVQTLVTATADREGWLLSGISLQKITSNIVTLTYHEYHRGNDEESCYLLSLQDGVLTQCDD
jgi:hypothetical protein